MDRKRKSSFNCKWADSCNDRALKILFRPSVDTNLFYLCWKEFCTYSILCLCMSLCRFPVTLFDQVVLPFQTTHDPHHQNNGTNQTDPSVHPTFAKVIIKNYWHSAGSIKVHRFTSFYCSILHVLLLTGESLYFKNQTWMITKIFISH